MKGYAEQGPDGSGNLTVMLFPIMPKAPYRVISTDYTSYAIVNSCRVYFGAFKYDWTWVLTRKPLEKRTKPWDEMQKKVLGILRSKFEYPGGSTKYWDPKRYIAPEQGDKFCDYSKFYTGKSLVD